MANFDKFAYKFPVDFQNGGESIGRKLPQGWEREPWRIGHIGIEFIANNKKKSRNTIDKRCR